MNPHDLRRHAATFASRSGTPIEIVSKVILRHASLSTTQRYLGLHPFLRKEEHSPFQGFQTPTVKIRRSIPFWLIGTLRNHVHVTPNEDRPRLQQRIARDLASARRRNIQVTYRPLEVERGLFIKGSKGRGGNPRTCGARTNLAYLLYYDLTVPSSGVRDPQVGAEGHIRRPPPNGRDHRSRGQE